MTQPKPTNSEHSQHSVKDHVKALLRKIPRKKVRRQDCRHQVAA